MINFIVLILLSLNLDASTTMLPPCVDPTPESFWEEGVNWLFVVFGEPLMKLFGVLYVISTIFTILSWSAQTIVNWTSWTTDNVLLKKAYDTRAYKVASSLAKFFMKLRMPRNRK